MQYIGAESAWMHVNGIIMHTLSVVTAVAMTCLLLQRTQLRHLPLTAMLTCCMGWSMQTALGILQESTAERADLSSCQVRTHHQHSTALFAYDLNGVFSCTVRFVLSSVLQTYVGYQSGQLPLVPALPYMDVPAPHNLSCQ